MGNNGIFSEFALFIKEKKAWWMIPILAMLLLVGVLIIAGQSSSLSPFIYALF